jgi:sulfate-transporting ATPase
MNQAFQLGLIGMSSGSLIAIAALGLVLIYRGSGIINFSQGIIGTLAAFTYWEFVTRGWGRYAAVAIALTVSIVCGYLIHKIVIRPMRDASVLLRTIATLAVLVILESALTIYFGPDDQAAPSLFPTRPLRILGVLIGEDRVILFFLAVVLGGALWFIYGKTKFGLATSAAAENVRAASALGISTDTIARVNWMIGALLAGAAGILLAPIVGVQILTQSQLIIPVLAAALVGGMRSFPLTFAGGLLIGVSQAEVLRYATAPGWGDAVPFLLILVMMAVRGGGVSVRAKLAERRPALGDGRVNAVTLAVFIIILAVLVEWLLSVEYVTALTVLFSFGIILLSSVVVTGYAGQLSLCQFTFAGIGAVIAGRLASQAHVPFLVALVVACVAAFPIGLALGLPVLRTRGVNLAVATLGLAVAAQSVLFQNGDYTGGVQPSVSEPTLFGWQIGSLYYPGRWTLFCAAVFVLCGLCVANLRRSQVGRRLLAVRANERAAQSLGINAYWVKLYAFSIAASIAAIGGVLVAFRYQTLVFNTGFDPFSSINGLVYSVVGGIGFIGGPVVAGVGQPGGIVPTALGSASTDVPYWVSLVGAALTIRLLQTNPAGAVEIMGKQARWVGRHLWRKPGRVKRSSTTTLGGTPALARSSPAKVVPQDLEARGISVRFGGVVAVDHVNVNVGAGQIVGVIGPNGAGKTSLIDALTGLVRASGGSVTLGGRSIGRQSMQRRSRAGLGRSFQSLELFDDMTVSDNLRVAAESPSWWSYAAELFWRRRSTHADHALQMIEMFGLQQDVDLMPNALSYGRRRLVGIARAATARPSVICLDEPAAGLSMGESQHLGTLLRSLADDFGMGLLLVEHDVNLVMGISDRVVAMEFGRVIADGTPEDVRRNPDVIRAYLGEDVHDGPDSDDVEKRAEVRAADRH